MTKPKTVKSKTSKDPWTDKELKILSAEASKGKTIKDTVRIVAKLTGRSYNSVDSTMRRLPTKVTAENTSAWKKAEVELLITHTLAGKSRPWIQKMAMPHRTVKAIEHKQEALGILPIDLKNAKVEQALETEARFNINDDAILDAIEQISKASKPLQDGPKEIYKHISTDLEWVGLVISGDWHIGNSTTYFSDLRKDVETVANTPGLYYGFNGDGTDNYTAANIAEGLHEQVISPRGARIAMGRLFKILENKMLFAVLGCHDSFSIRSADFNIVDMLTTDLKIPYLGRGGTLNLVLNDHVMYRIAARHKYRFNSSVNMANTCAQYVRHEDPHVDVVAISHNHVSHIGKEDLVGKPRILIRTGCYKPTDRYAESAGFLNSDCWVPVVLFNTKNKQMRIAASIQEAVEMLGLLNNGAK